MADINDFRNRHGRGFLRDDKLFGAYKLAILTGYTKRLTAGAGYQVNNLFVHRSPEYHLHHIHCAAVGDAHAVDKIRVDTEAFEQGANLRATTMNHDRV